MFGEDFDQRIFVLFANLRVESHHHEVTWVVPIEFRPGTDPSTLVIEGAVTVQPCDAKRCLPPQDVSFSAGLGEGLKLGAFATIFPKPDIGNQKPGVEFDPEKLNVADGGQITNILQAIGFGLLGGLILNLMPCVLPVIGLKIFSFMEQAGHSRGRALMLNIWYSLGLMSVFLLLATLAASAGSLARNCSKRRP